MPTLFRSLKAGARVALGLFVLWQLAFLLASNFGGLAKDACDRWPAPPGSETWGEEAVLNTAEAATDLTGPWARLTGQIQGWSLFAPDVADDCTFPAVELRWGEAARRDDVLLLSDNEPPDPSHYAALGGFRLRRYETRVAPAFSPRPGESEGQARLRRRQETERYLRREWDTVRAYLRLRMEAYLREHPGRPVPRQVILRVRRYHIVPPGEGATSPWRGPEDRTVARWRPGDHTPAACLPVEMFDPVTDRFRCLKRQGAGAAHE